MHSLLKRPFQWHFESSPYLTEQWQAFVNIVNGAYRKLDGDREMLKCSLASNAQAPLRDREKTPRRPRWRPMAERRGGHLTASAASQEQEALFRAAIDQAPQVVWIVDAQGAVTYLNRSWYELVGGAPPMGRGHDWAGVVVHEDAAEMRKQWKSARQSGTSFSGIRRVHGKDGSLHTLSYKASPVRDARGQVTCWIGMDADITETKAIETALRQSNRELEAFSYSVSHDLRSPLGSMAIFCSLLAKQLDAGDTEKAHHCMSRIHASVTHMSKLIESLLALAHVSRHTFRPVPVDLSGIASAVLAELRSREPDRRVKVAVEPALVVQGDPVLLHIAMENLLGNAWKFTSRQSDAEISVGRRAAEAAEPAFFVADNGVGFESAHADKLFGAFQRLHAAEEFPGTGIGLATVKRVIARHDGRVWADSQVGKGARFFFTLADSAPAGAPGQR